MSIRDSGKPECHFLFIYIYFLALYLQFRYKEKEVAVFVCHFSALLHLLDL